jgi:hypothetical protein
VTKRCLAGDTITYDPLKTSSSQLLREMVIEFTQYCEGDKIEKNEMGGACGTYGGRERCAQSVGGETKGTESIVESKT